MPFRSLIDRSTRPSIFQVQEEGAAALQLGVVFKVSSAASARTNF